MKLGFSTLGCPTWSIDQVIAAAVAYGYDGVEWRLIDGDVIDPVADRAKVEQAVRVCRQRGIEACCLDTSCRFNLSSAAAREAQVADLRNWIALAQAVQVPLLRVFGGADAAGSDEEEGTAWVASALKAAAPDAERAGVTVALETHDGFSSARRTAEVVRRVGSPNVGAIWDSHHPYRVGETPEQVIRALGDRLVHVHVKDAVRTAPGSNEWRLLLMGEGEVPVREQLQVLAQHNYQGWVCVEWEKKWHPEIPEPEVALPQHMAWLKRTLAGQ